MDHTAISRSQIQETLGRLESMKNATKKAAKKAPAKKAAAKKKK
jgi:hypothetical protein